MRRLSFVATALLSATLLSASAHAQRRASPPRIAFDGAFAYFGTVCDCDETDFVFRTRGPLTGHAEPSTSSPVVRMVDAGRLIEGNDWESIVTVVTRAATGTVYVPVRLDGARRMRDPRVGNWDTGVVVRRLTVPDGTGIAVYSNYGGEGYVNYGGTTYYGPVSMGAEVEWGPGGENATADETWFRLRARRGAPAAWVRIGWHDDPNVETLCGTHTGCVPGFTPTYRPNRQ